MDLPFTLLDGRRTSLAEWRGRVLLLVNVASECGYTPQYAGLQQLYETYRERGLTIIGFPCDQFGGQEPGTHEQIATFCAVNYGVTFPLAAKIAVNGGDAHPLWVRLKAERAGLLGTEAIKWNFTKFLVGRDGRVVERFAPNDEPATLAPAVERELARTEPPPPSRRRRWHWSDLIWIAALLYALPVLLPHVGAVLGVRAAARPTPAFAYETLAGDTVAADRLRGQVVLVNFWATWCLPCRAEMPALESMYGRHRGAGFVIVGLAVDQAPTAEVAAFVRERGITYPIAHVGREAEARFGGVQGYPTSFLIGRDGAIRHVVMGPIGAVSLEPAVRRALDEAPPAEPAAPPAQR